MRIMLETCSKIVQRIALFICPQTGIITLILYIIKKPILIVLALFCESWLDFLRRGSGKVTPYVFYTLPMLIFLVYNCQSVDNRLLMSIFYYWRCILKISYSIIVRFNVYSSLFFKLEITFSISSNGAKLYMNISFSLSIVCLATRQVGIIS